MKNDGLSPINKVFFGYIKVISISYLGSTPIQHWIKPDVSPKNIDNQTGRIHLSERHGTALP